MTVKKTSLSTEKSVVIDSPEFPRSVQIPPMEESGVVDALLRRVCDQTAHPAFSSFTCHDREEYDHIGAEALQRVVDDLQFGHDLRL